MPALSTLASGHAEPERQGVGAVVDDAVAQGEAGGHGDVEEPASRSQQSGGAGRAEPDRTTPAVSIAAAPTRVHAAHGRPIWSRVATSTATSQPRHAARNTVRPGDQAPHQRTAGFGESGHIGIVT